MSTHDHHFEDFAVGQRWTSQGRTIGQHDIDTFAAWSWDTNPVHTDAVTTADGRFGERIAHGLLGVSVTLGLVSRLGLFEGCSIALLGIDDWKFHAPVRSGDTVHCELEITGTRLTSRGDAGILERHLTLLNQDGERVQSGRIDLMVSVRPKSSRDV